MGRLAAFILVAGLALTACQGVPEQGAPAPILQKPPGSLSDAGGDAPDASVQDTDGGSSSTGGDAGVPDAGPVPAGGPVYDAGTAGNGNATIGPAYADSSELSPPADAPRGTVYRFTMSSEDSVIYPGLTGAYTRGIAVYIPKQYVDGAPAPFMVVQDGSGFVDDMKDALDTLIHKKAAPHVVVIFVNSGGGDGRGSERGLEYDRVSAHYTQFIETEVLPAVRGNSAIKAAYPKLTFTTDPEGRGSMGCSSGGAAAFTMGWFHPELYRRILTYSGTFVNQHPEAAYPGSAWEYHQKLIAAAEAKPLRVFLQVGSRDLNLDDRFGDKMHNWMTANKAMAARLAEKGYPYQFLYAEDAAHCDGRVRRQTLPDALRWLWRGFPVP